MKLLLEKDSGLIDSVGSAMYPPLYRALSQGLRNAIPVVRMLLEFGVSATGKISWFHDLTQLYLAVYCKNLA